MTLKLTDYDTDQARAGALDRAADLHLAEGRHRLAEQLADRAAWIRGQPHQVGTAQHEATAELLA